MLDTRFRGSHGLPVVLGWSLFLLLTGPARARGDEPVGVFEGPAESPRPMSIYGMTGAGDVVWYFRGYGVQPRDGGKIVREGISPGSRLISAGRNSFYIVDEQGEVSWLRHESIIEGRPDWKGPLSIGSGWQKYRLLLAGGEGVVYGVRHDGTLFWMKNKAYRDMNAGDPYSWDGPKQVGSGWDVFSHVLSMGDGVLYGVRPDGEVFWYKHEGYASGEPTWAEALHVASGWQRFSHFAPAGDGIILAVDGDGSLYQYRHLDYSIGRSTDSEGTAGPPASAPDLSHHMTRLGTTPAPGGSAFARAGTASGVAFGAPHWSGPERLGSGWSRFESLVAIRPDEAIVSPGQGFQVFGAVGDKWNSLGGATGPLGAARSGPLEAARGGSFNLFEHGYVYWHPSLGAFAVYGEIGRAWDALGRERGFGFPISDVLESARGGRFVEFEDNRSIYWHRASGAHAVIGAIRERWNHFGREHGGLGYPRTDELAAGAGWRFNEFDGGVIYWHRNFGPIALYGRIGDEYRRLGREKSSCGYPIREEGEFDDGRDTGEYGIGKRFLRADFTNGYLLFSKGRGTVLNYCGQPPAAPIGTGGAVEVCAYSVVATNGLCRDRDGTPSERFDPGALQVSGCGSSIETAERRARLAFAAAVGCAAEGPEGSPGCCVIELTPVAGCMCQ